MRIRSVSVTIVAVKTKSRELELGNPMSAITGELGMNPTVWAGQFCRPFLVTELEAHVQVSWDYAILALQDYLGSRHFSSPFRRSLKSSF